MPASQHSKPPARGKSRKTVERILVMESLHGLHARPADLLIKTLSRFRAEVTARSGGEWTDARSILGLLGLAVGFQSKIIFTASGPDASEAIAAIEQLFERRFDEAYTQPESEPSGNTCDPQPGLN